MTDAADEKAREVTPCSREKDGKVPCLCITNARPAVAAALREASRCHNGKVCEDQIAAWCTRCLEEEEEANRGARERITALEAENAELKKLIAHPPLRAWKVK